MPTEDLASIRAAKERIRRGDWRVDVELRGQLANLLERIADHAESEYQCCDHGMRRCFEIGDAAMDLVDAINGRVT